jgi:hypothetical protein
METNAEIEAEEKAGERRLFEGCEWFIIPILVLSIFAAAWQLRAELSWRRFIKVREQKTGIRRQTNCVSGLCPLASALYPK